MSDTLNNYSVETSLEYQGYSIDNTVDVEAYNEDEAAAEAIEGIIRNVLIYSCDTRVDGDEDDYDTSKEYEVTVRLESNGHTLDFDLCIDAYTEDEAEEEAISKVRDNLVCLSNGITVA